MPQTLEPEDLIRTYLKMLDDPAALVDTQAIAHLEDAVRSATDPIDKLKALAALNKAKTPDVDFYKTGFVQHARAWAEANEVPFDAFAALGVSRDVLRSAGLVGGGRQRAATKSASRKSVSASEIESELRRLEGVFTLADVARDIGGSPMTVRKAVEKLVAEGQIIRLGPTPNWTGRGRAPLQFRQA